MMPRCLLMLARAYESAPAARCSCVVCCVGAALERMPLSQCFAALSRGLAAQRLCAQPRRKRGRAQAGAPYRFAMTMAKACATEGRRQVEFVRYTAPSRGERTPASRHEVARFCPVSVARVQQKGGVYGRSGATYTPSAPASSCCRAARGSGEPGRRNVVMKGGYRQQQTVVAVVEAGG